jgi:hypothetical protein
MTKAENPLVYAAFKGILTRCLQVTTKLITDAHPSQISIYGKPQNKMFTVAVAVDISSTACTGPKLNYRGEKYFCQFFSLKLTLSHFIYLNGMAMWHITSSNI